MCTTAIHLRLYYTHTVYTQPLIQLMYYYKYMNSKSCNFSSTYLHSARVPSVFSQWDCGVTGRGLLEVAKLALEVACTALVCASRLALVRCSSAGSAVAVAVAVAVALITASNSVSYLSHDYCNGRNSFTAHVYSTIRVSCDILSSRALRFVLHTWAIDGL